jgi:hypothetical protein
LTDASDGSALAPQLVGIEVLIVELEAVRCRGTAAAAAK